MNGIFDSLFSTLSETILGFITHVFDLLFGGTLG